MKLLECLESYEYGTDVAVGSANGSGWMFFGNAEHTSIIDSCYEEYKYRISRNIEEYREEIQFKKSHPTQRKGRFDLMPENEFKRRELNRMLAIQELETRNSKLISYLENWTPVLDREVVKTYTLEDPRDRGRIMILIEGIEKGYWTEKEYTSGVIE